MKSTFEIFKFFKDFWIKKSHILEYVISNSLIHWHLNRPCRAGDAFPPISPTTTKQNFVFKVPLLSEDL